MADLNEVFADDLHAPGSGDLNVLRLNDNPVLVTVFTSETTDLRTHYVAESNIGEVQCNMDGETRCLLCEIGNQAADRYLLPVYVVRDDEVQVLPITATRRPHSLGPQLTAEIRKGELDKRYLRITRSSSKYTVVSVPAQEGHEMGESVIKRFRERLSDAGIDLKGAIPVYGNLQLFDVPEIERVATAMGISRSRFAVPDENDS